MKLSELKRGATGRIVAVNAKAGGMLRLMVLGLVEGVEITHIQCAIGGDPLEIEVMGASVSVRREQAQHITLETAGING